MRPGPLPAAAGQVMMQAIVQRRYGTAPEDVLRLEQIARPAIKADEVLVRVRAASVDRGTWHLMTGMPYLMRIMGFGLRGPRNPVPGLAVAGTVEAVGRDVTGLAPGDEVFGTGKGCFAQYATARASRLAPKPAGLTFEQAAAVPVSANAALQAIRDHAKVRPGQHVLVIGASGGVGTFAVQIAKAFGAEVTGVSSTAKTDLVRAVGADHVIDYTREDPVAGRHRYDVIIDIGGSRRLAQLRRALAPKGTLVITGGEDVTGFAPGDAVFGTCRGSFAQYTVAKASRLAAKPASLTFEQAAALPNSANTALRAVRDKAKVRPGQHVLVIGAGGGVGTFAVQIAKAFGAEVTAASGTAKTDLVRAIGADHVLDYTREDPVSGQRRYDVVIDIGGDRPVARLRRALTPKGTLVLTGGTGGPLLGGMDRNMRAQLLSPFVSQRLTAFIAPESRADLITLGEMADSGAITPAIDRAYPLSQAAAALRHLAEGHTRGKIVISV